jgi:hypothetical protein
MIFGVGERGTAIALRATARWSFLLFWPAYTGAALARLFGNHFTRIARRGRDFGLAFGAAQLVHVGLVVWLFYQAPGSNGGMAFFWIEIFCTYLLALLSLQKLQATLGPRLWRTLRTAAMEYIALVFAADFILGPLQANAWNESFELSAVCAATDRRNRATCRGKRILPINQARGVGEARFGSPCVRPVSAADRGISCG